MVLNNENETKNWDKSLVLIVDSETASAAEIFASAFKEFNIGVIIGEPTFGKGTVQEFIDLNVYNSKKNDDSDMGALRMTIQKFYNLNGKSVQKTGVFPDINFSTLNTLDREKSKPNTLDPDSVKAINFTSINKPDFFKNIIINSQIRLSKKPEYNYLINDKSVDELKKIKTQYPKVFKSEMEDYLKKNSASPLANYNNNLVFEPTVADIKMLRKKGYLSQKRKNWYQALTHDFIVDEAINILEDINSLK